MQILEADVTDKARRFGIRSERVGGKDVVLPGGSWRDSRCSCALKELDALTEMASKVHDIRLAVGTRGMGGLNALSFPPFSSRRPAPGESREGHKRESPGAESGGLPLLWKSDR